MSALAALLPGLGARALVMGVLNLTPDSFSDGGRLDAPGAVLDRARTMLAEGAAILDLGGESTRPGAAPVDAQEEEARVLPALRALAPLGAVLSIDTSKARVAEAALRAGAVIVNDVWGFQRDPDIARVAAGHGAAAVLTRHREGIDAAADPLAGARAFLSRSVEIALGAGVREDAILLDPGLGFGLTPAQNFALVARLPDLAALGFPLLVGGSRKSFLAPFARPGAAPEGRLAATLALHVAARLGGAAVLRAHDVAAHVEALGAADAVIAGRQSA